MEEKNLAPIYLHWLDVTDNFQDEIITKQIDQLDFLNNYSTISPSFLYRRLIESMNNKGQHEFEENVRLFRQHLMQTVIELDKTDTASFHLCFLPNYMSTQAVNWKKRSISPQKTGQS